jgi:gas vesicle protein
MKGDTNNLKTSDKLFKETREVLFPEKKAKDKKKKLFHVSYETCSELEGMYKASSKKEAKHLFKKEYQRLPRDFEDKIKVKEIPE